MWPRAAPPSPGGEGRDEGGSKSATRNPRSTGKPTQTSRIRDVEDFAGQNTMSSSVTSGRDLLLKADLQGARPWLISRRRCGAGREAVWATACSGGAGIVDTKCSRQGKARSQNHPFMRRFRSQEFTRTHGHASLARAINARFLFAIGIIAIPLPPAAAQAPPEPPQINVSGSAEVKVAPDEIDLDVGVETRHETLAEAKRQNDERVSSALKFLKRIGIEDKDVQTDFVGIEPT